MAKILFGAETEYAVAGRKSKQERSTDEVAMAIVEMVPRRFKFVRDAGSSGGFYLGNGGRLYVDCGTHPEYSTPECTNPWDVVRHIEAGHRILAELAGMARGRGGQGKDILCFRSNVDYSGSGSTWGSHESYLTKHDSASIRDDLIPHLVTRPIYTGAGGFKPSSRGLQFVLSPRLSHFHRVEGSNSTSDRGIWHEKGEPLSGDYDRVHIVCGESLCSQTALLLKSGATALIVAMADAGLDPGDAVALANPIAALQAVIRDVRCRTKLQLRNGAKLTPIELQRHYLEMSEAHIADAFMPEWAGVLCGIWRNILDDLAAGPDAVANTLDWAIKYKLYLNQAKQMGIQWDTLPEMSVIAKQESVRPNVEQSMEAEPLGIQGELPWPDMELREGSPVEVENPNREHAKDFSTSANSRKRLFEIDMRFGQIGPEGIFEALEAAGALNHRVVAQEEIGRAMTSPPEGSRARIRGEVVQHLSGSSQAKCDWNHVIDANAQKALDLSDPFCTAEAWKHFEPSLDDRSDEHMMVFPFDSSRRGLRYSRRGSHVNSPLDRREQAYIHFLNGRYQQAEELLRTCIADRFELGSNHCHLARILMVMEREEEARIEVGKAWEFRINAASYVTPRILFFRLLFGILDGSDVSETLDAMKSCLADGGASSSWTIQPILDHIRPRLCEEDYEFLKVLASALSGECRISMLDGHVRWRTVAIDQGPERPSQEAD